MGWIVLWSVGFLFCLLGFIGGIFGLLSWPQHLQAQVITVARVIAYPYSIALIARLLFWEIFGTETIESTPNGLTLTRRIGFPTGFWSRQWYFSWDALQTLELAPPLPKGKQADLPWTLERGTLRLHLGGDEVRFGIRLERNAALSLIEEVQALVRRQER